MEDHHRKAIEKFCQLYKEEPTVSAILLGGSIAHGFATPASDIDLIIIVDELEYKKKKKDNNLAFSLRDICDYPGGYIDCKVINRKFLNTLIDRGSDPARYAFQDSIILFSKITNLEQILEEIVKFPVQEKAVRRKRFASQLLAWKWFYGEGIKKQNQYLIYLSIQKLVLFSSRLVLNENNMLYPYHKWLLSVLGQAQDKPGGFEQAIIQLMTGHTLAIVEEFCHGILDYAGVDEKNLDWPNQFLLDSELNWVEHEAPVDDL